MRQAGNSAEQKIAIAKMVPHDSLKATEYQQKIQEFSEPYQARK